MKIVVLTSCTARKLDHPASAEQLYQGQQHVRLMRGVRAARERGDAVDVWVISALHGLIPGHQVVEPYDASFNDMTPSQRRKLRVRWQLASTLDRLFSESPYDLGLICLGRAYAEHLDLDRIRYAATTLRLIGTAGVWSSAAPNYYEVPAGPPQTATFGCGLVGLKGEIAGRILERMPEEPATLRYDPSPLL